MVASPLTGLQPMLAEKGDRLETLVGTHMFDEKLDGLRAMVAYDGEHVWLRGRNGANLLPHFPEIEDAALVMLPPGIVLDGEITTTTFEDVNHRAMLKPTKIALWRDRPLATFNAFDVVRHARTGTDDASWEMRRLLLDGLTLNGRFRATTVSPDADFFDTIRAAGGEGVIAKRITSRYRAGRSRDWLKFKATSRITCIAYGYLPGSGSRADFGAVLLAVIDDQGKAVPVGKAGSGFNARSLAEVKALLDASTLVTVEIECLGITTGNVLRQPVFRGVRADLSPLQATASQLDSLPKG